MQRIYSIITGTGSYIPARKIKNEAFMDRSFYESNGERINRSNEEILSKFEEITTIAERNYVEDDQTTSDIAYLAAVEAIRSANIDAEELDYVILAHNFGDVRSEYRKSEYVPCLAAKVKHRLGIVNPSTVAYDTAFGCPGWLQAVIQADYYIRSGDASKVLVIGAEVLSRVSDPHDRDSLLYADGAGAVVLEARQSEQPIGILGHATRSDTAFSSMLYMGKSYHPDLQKKNDLYLKMNGRRLYQYALETVPQAIKSCLDKCNTSLKDIQKVLIHQANGKMDEAILKRLYQVAGCKEIPENVMPMTVDTLGNSSVATLPTLFDLIRRNKLKNHVIEAGDTVVFASVGAGMNINALVYKMAN